MNYIKKIRLTKNVVFFSVVIMMLNGCSKRDSTSFRNSSIGFPNYLVSQAISNDPPIVLEIDTVKSVILVFEYNDVEGCRVLEKHYEFPFTEEGEEISFYLKNNEPVVLIKEDQGYHIYSLQKEMKLREAVDILLSVKFIPIEKSDFFFWK